MNKPKRIQRKRTKGWKMPSNALYVGRPTMFGNPFKIDAPHPRYGFPMTAQECVDLYKEWLTKLLPEDKEHMIACLKGSDLACWCRLDQPCHADVLLELANKD